ncbi:hypothetical protein ACJJIE_03780 [Microbulbifer sp. TRSA001]|uniref:hypothetical protein n=1 Tax=Microbulbifer sp. TRSA001 TaxID=3243381 RepID=UPI00403A756A
MSVITISEAAKRISQTDPGSPLAVFQTEHPRRVNVVFANTVWTQKCIARGTWDFLGVFHRENLPEALKTLDEYAENMKDAA